MAILLTPRDKAIWDEARIYGLEEAAQIVDKKWKVVYDSCQDSCPEFYLEDVADEIRAAKDKEPPHEAKTP